MKRLFSSGALCAASLVVLAMAGTGVAQTQKKAVAIPDCAPVEGQLLKCPKLGFSYKVPFGWVNRTDEMQPEAEGQSTSSPVDGQAGKTLLAVFERPPGVGGEGVNPAVIIAAEGTANYPQLKNVAEYFGPLSQVAEEHGLKLDGDPYSFAVGARQLVRGDFVSNSGESTVRQTSLVFIEKSLIVSFTFVSRDEDEMDELIENLSFGAPAKATTTHEGKR